MPESLVEALAFLLVFVGTLAVGGFGLLCLRVAYDLLCANRAEYRAVQNRVGSIRAVALGEVRPDHDCRRDHRVHAGIAVDRRTNTWVPRGQVSKDALDVIFPH